MIDTIQKGLAPLLWLGRFYGLVALEYPANHLRPLLTTFYILAGWTFYGSISCYLLHLFPRTIHAEAIIFVAFLFFNIFIAAVGTVLSIYFRQTFRNCIDGLGIVDDTLEEFGVPKEYPKIFKISFVLLVVWLLLHFLVTSVHAKWEIDIFKSAAAFALPHMMNYALYMNTITDVMIWVLVGYTGSRFQRVNKCMETLGYDVIDDDKWAVQTSFMIFHRRNTVDLEKCKHMLRVLMHLHLELCKISQGLNRIFGAHLCLQVTSHFIFILIVMIYTIKLVAALRKGNTVYLMEFLVLCAWGVLHVGKLVIMNYMCEMLSRKGNRLTGTLGAILNTIQDDEVQSDGVQFNLQLLQKPLRFTGLGLFDFGYEFIKRFFAYETTVLIILLQMKILPQIRHTAKVLSENDVEI